MLMSSDFNQFVELKKGKPVIDMEEAYIMLCGADLCAGETAPLSCVRGAIAASAATKAGHIPTQNSRGAKNTVQLAQSTFPSKVT